MKLKLPYNIFIIFFLLITTDAISQNDKRSQEGKYVQGFIIENDNDTIHGLVKIEDYELSEVRVKFKSKKKSKKKKKKVKYNKAKTYKPNDLNGYAFKIAENNNSVQIVEKWIHYERKRVDEPPRPFASRTVFLERKESGTLNLYLYFIRSNQGAKLKRYFIIEHSNSGHTQKVTQKNFDEVVGSFVDDCSQLVNRVGRADFTYYNLDRIIYSYNRCLIEASPD